MPRKSFFSAIPNELQDDARLKPRDLQVIASILRYARQKNWASMSNQTLANHGHCSERTAQLSLVRLEATGWILRKSTDADIGSNTGRIIYLSWRTGETLCAPPLSSIAPPPVSSIAPEVEKQKRERKPAPLSLDGSGPGGQTKDSPTPPTGPLDYAALGWLDRPASDPLRKIAEKAIAARLAGPPAPSPIKRPPTSGAGLPGAPGTLVARLGRVLAGGPARIRPERPAFPPAIPGRAAATGLRDGGFGTVGIPAGGSGLPDRTPGRPPT